MKKKIKIMGITNEKDFYNDSLIKMLETKYDIEMSEDPEYVLSGNPIADYLEYDCVRIQSIGENLRPDFNVTDYAVAFDFMNFGDRYLRYPLYVGDNESFLMALKKNRRSEADFMRRKKFCNMVVSNGRDVDPYREKLFDALCYYKQVDSGGKYRNNVGGPVKDKYEFQSNYRFSIACENSSTSGYVTEKIIQAWAAGTIPIYWGEPEIAEEFNSKAFINCMKFDSVDDVISEIKKIDQDDELYLKMQYEPITGSGLYVNGYLNDEKYKEFIWHIFDQNPLKAIRRTNYKHGYGKIYEYRLREYNDYKYSNGVKAVRYLEHKIGKTRNIWKDEWNKYNE